MSLRHSLLSCSALALAPFAAAFTPYFYDDFEGRPLDTMLPSPYSACGRSKATAEQAHSGSRSARMEIRVGDGGAFGRWGTILGIRPALTKGQEVWVRLYVYWPASFTFSASPWMKFLRLHTSPAGGGNTGYHDLYIDNADSTTSVLRTIKEVHDKWAVYDGAPIARDRWERYEMYVKLDNLSVDQGGEGRVRIWRDGQLIFDRTDVPTLVSATDTLDAFYLFTYWNNENPPDNHCYVDDLAIATSESPPPQTDANGNRMIGTWNGDPTTYAEWRAAGFSGSDLTNDAISGPDADPDGTGLTNFARYAFDVPVRGPVANPVTLGTATVEGAQYFTLTFPRRATANDLTYILESSTDLITWTTVPGRTYTAGTSPITAQDIVPLTSESRRFLRLRLAASP